MTKLEIIQRLSGAGRSEAITLASLNEANGKLQQTVADLALAIQPLALALEQLLPLMHRMENRVEQIERWTSAMR